MFDKKINLHLWDLSRNIRFVPPTSRYIPGLFLKFPAEQTANKYSEIFITALETKWESMSSWLLAT